MTAGRVKAGEKKMEGETVGEDFFFCLLKTAIYKALSLNLCALPRGTEDVVLTVFFALAFGE